MQRTSKRGMRRIYKISVSIVLVIIFTALMALLGFHLASRYRATIMNLFDNVTEKISGIENNIREEAETVISIPES